MNESLTLTPAKTYAILGLVHSLRSWIVRWFHSRDRPTTKLYNYWTTKLTNCETT